MFLPALPNPVVLAHQLATLDQISENRLVLGAGIASDVPNIRAEFVAAGVPFEGRVGRMMEGLRLARALWAGEPVDWDGRWRVEGGVLGPTPYQRPADLARRVGPAGLRAGGPAFRRLVRQRGELSPVDRAMGRGAGDPR